MFNLSVTNLKSVLLVAASLTVSACGGGGSGGGNPPPPTRNAETVVFIGNDGITTTGQNELYAVEDDSTTQRMLSKNTVANDSNIFKFAISPDKQWVAYIADHDGSGKYALYTIAISGGTPKQVSRSTSILSRTVKSFHWSPDSRQLVFAANLDAPFDANSSYLANEVYIVNRDGTNQRKINGSIGIPATVEAKNPQWSPDGRYIVQEVASFSNGSADRYAFALNIYDTTITASNSRRLVTANTNRIIRNVHWSPDSKRLAFTSDYTIQDSFQVVVIGISGSPFKQLTINGDFNSESEWSPNGSELAYLDHPSSPFPADLVVSPGDGSAAKRFLAVVSNNNRSVKDFRWSPDGSQIAYTSDEDQQYMYELYVIAANGSGTPTKINGSLITFGDVFEFQWSPNGKQIAYRADQQTDRMQELFVSNINGTGNIKVSSGLTNSKVFGFDWSADSSRLAFSEGPSSRRSTGDRVYINTTDGNNLLQVSDVTTDVISSVTYNN